MKEVRNILGFSENLLRNVNVDNPFYESKVILCNVIKKKLLDIFVDETLKISNKQKKAFYQKIFKRMNGKPLSKIFGFKEFYSNIFFTNTFTLDPRPETELIIDVVKKKTLNKKKIKILELGTGSGCLIISLILELTKQKNVTGIGVDLCDESLKVSKKNVSKYGLQNKIKIFKSNWFSNINEKFDIIVSNPPYIKSKTIPFLTKEVRNFDPHVALDGGENGLDSYRDIAKECSKFLFKGGIICLEIGENQCNEVKKMFQKKNLNLTSAHEDLSGIKRVLVFENKI